MPFNAGQAVGYLDLDTSNFTKGLKSAYKQLQVFQKESATTTQKATAIGNAFKAAGTTLTKNLTVPLVAAGAASLKAGIDFESAFAGIRKTVDATEQEFSAIRTGILELTKTMPQSASELAKIGEAAGQLGIKTENILSFTKAMAMLADSTNLSSEQAATALARFANITGMSQDNFERLGSVIVDLGNNFATTEAEIVDMATNVAAAGTQIGLTEPQIMAISAAMSSLGLESAMGGTAFSRILREIQLAVETASPELASFAEVANMSIDEFSKAFKEDAASAIESFLIGLTDTNRMGASTIKILNDLGIKETRTIDTVSRLANAHDLLSGSIDMANKAWEENVALSNEAEKRYATTASQLKILWNNITRIGIQIADKLLPSFNKLVKNLQEVADWFTNLDDATVEFIVNAGLLIVAIGPIMNIFGKLVLTLTKLNSMFKISGTSATALKAAMTALSSPVGMVALAIGGLTAVIAGFVIATKDGTEAQRQLKKSMDETEKSYKTSIDSIKTQETNLLNNTKQAKSLIDEMYNLSNSNMDTATKVQILNSMQKELQELIPDLVIEIDKETGRIITQRSKVDELTNSYIKMSTAKLYSEKSEAEADRYTKAMQDRIKATNLFKETRIKMAEQEEKLARAQYEYENAQTFSAKRRAEMDIDNAKSRIQNLKVEQDKNYELYEKNNKVMEEAKKNLDQYQKDQEALTQAITEDLGLQTKVTIENNEDKIKSNEETLKYDKKITEDRLGLLKKEQKAKEEAAKEAEKLAKESKTAENKRYKELIELNKEYREELDKINQDYAEKEKELTWQEIERIQELNAEYDKAVQDRAKSIAGAYGLFDKFAEEDEDNPITGKQLLKNLKSQLSGIKQWRQDLKELTERGVTGGLLEELQELGPKAAIEIGKLNDLSDTKLQEYIDTWEQIQEEAKKQAEIDLEPERKKTDEKINEVMLEYSTKFDELNKETDSKLNELKVTYTNKLQELGVTVVPTAQESGVQIIKAIEIGVEEEEETLMAKLEEVKQNVIDMVRDIQREVRKAERAASSVRGSHKNGLDYVPYDGYVAELHQGERVLTKQENKKYNENKVKTTGKQKLDVNFTGTMGQLIRILKPEFTLEDDRGGEEY